MDDIVHLFVSCPPEFLIRKLVKILRGGTSFYIRECHPSLRKYSSFWHWGFMYWSVGAVSAEIVERYINNSNHWIDATQKRLV